MKEKPLIKVVVGDKVRLGDYNYVGKDVVISSRLADLLGKDNVTVTGVESDDMIYVNNIPDPIPLSMVREITKEHYTEAERKRASVLKQIFVREADWYNTKYDKFMNVSIIIIGIIAAIVGIILGIEVANECSVVIDGVVKEPALKDKIIAFILAFFICGGIVMFIGWVIRETIFYFSYIKKLDKEYDERLLAYPQVKSLTKKEMERLYGMKVTYTLDNGEVEECDFRCPVAIIEMLEE